ncbi:hypothetical protein B0H17DRAFT_1050258, partial [Mycena rosella]
MATSHFLEISTIIGITLVQTLMVFLWTMWLILSAVPSTRRAIVWYLHVTDSPHFTLLRGCIVVIPGWGVCAVVAFLLELHPRLTAEAQQTLWNSLSFTRRARREMRIVLWQVVWYYEDWKAAQLEAFHELTAGLPNTLLKAWCGIWSHLHPTHKLLIVAPAIIFYGYFCFIPAARRIPWLIEKWRRR